MARPHAIPAVIMLLMAGSLACTTATQFFGLKPGGGTAPGGVETQSTEAVATLDTALGVEPTSAPVQRLELRPSPTPFHVTEQNDPRAILDLGDPDYLDYFDVPEKWFDYDTPGRAAYGVADGKLWGLDYEPDELYSWWSYTDKQTDLVYAEVSATNGDCVGKDAVGFVIHSSPETAAGGYGLEVSCDGAWRFLKHRVGKMPQEIIEWTPSDVIQTGKDGVNRLGIWDHFGKFYFFINGVMVGESRDTPHQYPGGTFALYVKAAQTYNLKAWFYDLASWELPFEV
jgi:hypothetical protein